LARIGVRSIFIASILDEEYLTAESAEGAERGGGRGEGEGERGRVGDFFLLPNNS
jgi:hypothetical protein